VPSALVATNTPSRNAMASSCGMGQRAQPERPNREDWSPAMVSPSVSIGKCQKGAPLKATPTDTGALDAAKATMGPKRALERRRHEALSPYNREAWSEELLCHSLWDKYPSLIWSFTEGFDLGIPSIHHTYTPPNHHSISLLADMYKSIVENEFAMGRYISPFTHAQLETDLGPFQSSPLSLIPKAAKPGKYCAVHDFSHPHNPLPNIASINSHINSDAFPCTWGTFSTVDLLFARLPPGSQASVRDVAEAYRTIPVAPSQWPGLVIHLQAHDQFAVNVCNNFGLTSAGGIYGMVADAGTDIFRGSGIGLVAKWVDDHIFFRILCAALPEYNAQRKVWHSEIRAHRGCRQDGSRLWYGGKNLPDGSPEEFDEDCSTTLKNLMEASPRAAEDRNFAYADADIDKLSACLGIRWEPSKTVLFSTEVPYLGFRWDLRARMVHLLEEKKTKYLAAITEWESRCMHNLLDTQRLYGKLLHATMVIPAGRAYLTNLEAMLASFNANIFLPHTPPRDTPSDLEWWKQQLSRAVVSRSISEPRPPPATMKPTLMPVPGSELPSQLAPSGARGFWPQDGSPKDGTSSGPKPSALNCSSSVYAHFQAMVSTSQSMGTTKGSSKGGGRDPAITSPPTASSDASSNYRRIAIGLYTQNMSQVPRTPLMPPQEAATPIPTSSSVTLPSLQKSDHSSSRSTPVELTRGAALKRLVRTWDVLPSAEPREVKRQKPLNTRLCPLPLPPATAMPDKRPALYPQNLTPAPLHLRPHCLARDRLRLWVPATSGQTAPSNPTLSKAEREQIKDTMVHAWEEDTRTTYGAGLLMWQCFCDARGVSEQERAPASQGALSAFVAHMAAAYSGKTISNYLNGVRAWHILHSVPWALEKKEMDTMLQAADKLTPSTSKKKQRLPYTPAFIAAIKQQLNLQEPLDTAVFACLTTCFYASARLGEFTVQTLSGFNPNVHITLCNLSYDQDRNGCKVTVLHLPRTKATGNAGEDVYWAFQEGDTDSTAALQNHLQVNQPSKAMHLFAYRAKHARRPLTKMKFLGRVAEAVRTADLEPLQGHGIRIGSTLEYLLWGIPFDIMKAQGRWAGNSFLLYLRKHAVVIAPYIQAKPPVHEAFICYTMPPVC
jgi:hypothetical protein